MASSNKKRTTMAKLNRENKLREKRADKQARKDARKRDAALGVSQHIPVMSPVPVIPDEAPIPE